MRWSLVLLLLSIGCGEEVQPGKCQSGKKEIDGVCRLSCARDGQCLLSEVCTDGACMPMADPQLPVIRLFAADPSTVQPGGGTLIDYVVLFADSVDMVGDGVEGTVNVLGQTDRLAGTVEVSPLQKSIDVTLTARRNNGSTATDQLTIRVSDPNLPAIDYFTADPIVVSPGDFTELSWGTTNAATARITGGEGPYEDLPVTGNISVSVQQTTQFTLEVEDADGDEVTAKVTVEVQQSEAPAIVDFLALPPVVPFEIPAVVVWRTDRATDIQLLDGLGREIMRSESLFEAAAGAWMFRSPVDLHDFTLVAKNSAGTIERSIPIQRLPQPGDAMLQLLQASPLIAEPGVELTVSWQAGPPQNVEVDLYLDGSPIRVNPADTYVTTLFDETTPREVRLVATVPGGGVAEAKHIVYGQTPDVPSTRVSPQVLDRQAVNGGITPDGSLVGDWFSVYVPAGGGLDVLFLACPSGMTAEIIDPNTEQTLDSGVAFNGTCPRLSSPGFGYELSIHLSLDNAMNEAPYLMVPQVIDAPCGDFAINGFETCDDGNRRPFDGCDGFCQDEPFHQYRVEQAVDPSPPVPAGAVAVSGWRQRGFEPAEDEGFVVVPIFFPFVFFGRDYHGLVLHTNGFVNLLPDFESAGFDPHHPLYQGEPNAVISLFGADLIATPSSETLVWADGDSLSIELVDYAPKDDPANLVSGRITLFEGGRIRLDFAKIESALFFQFGVEAPKGDPIFTLSGCEDGCSGDLLGQLGAVDIIPGGL